MSRQRGGFHGPESELRRRIAFNQTMIERTREKAGKKMAEYQAKADQCAQELNALMGAAAE